MKRIQLLGLIMFLATLGFAQSSSSATTNDETTLSEAYHGLKFRNIGPFRGGRSNAVTGVPNNPLTYYFGSTGGGVWKTEDAGISWKNISDGFFETGSVGAIAIAPSDQNVIYVGMGEHAVRGVMTSHGDGVYKSTDAGKTWKNIGLPNSRHIAEIRVHPEDSETVYVAVQGALHKDSEDRGVYRSNDGGANWEKILYIDETTGAADLSIDINNPRILYAGMWSHRRYPWQVVSGGEGSGLWKSINGGDTWEELKGGLPASMGKVAIDVSPANSDIVYANIEAEGEKAGVYRSNDSGKSWTQTSKDRITIARSWYYIEIFADPKDENKVYVLNAPMLKSIDGGKTFKTIPNPHTDQHHLWINPDNTENIILANDGGACITFNGGESWSSQQNQPTAQFYRVIADNRFPYHIYAGQQDNSTVAIASRTSGSSIDWKDWYAVAGGESAFLAFDPDNPRYVYGGSYQGNISVYDHETDTDKDIMAYPVVGLGWHPSEMKYRFNWNAPIVTAPQDRSVIYHAGNKVLKSTNRGQSWEEISPDLTRNDKAKQVLGGAPYTVEGAGGENYGAITYMVASPHQQGVLWTGSDDGLIHLTQNDGADWKDVTPKGLGEVLINAIEVSPHNASTAYVAVTNYKMGDFTPMLYVTNDYGKTWKNKVEGIAEDDFVRVVREDPKQAGILYAGTETGLYISFDKGDSWESFQLNLPVCPILDLYIQDNDLIVATSGRAFWILDDLSAVQQSKGKLEQKMTIFQPKPTYKFNVNTPKNAPTGAGQNPMSGVIIDYAFAEALDSTEVMLSILDSDGRLVRSYSSKKDENFKQFIGGPSPEATLPIKKGVNRFNWDLRRATIPGVEGVFMLGDYSGGLVAPGTYSLVLSADEESVETTVEVIPDPRIKATQAAYEAQQEILVEAVNAAREIHESVNAMRKVKKQLVQMQETLEKRTDLGELKESAKEIVEKITNWEDNLIQRNQKTFQDVINFPNQLNAEFMNLKSRVDGLVPNPTQGAEERLNDLMEAWSKHKIAMKKILNEEVITFNEMYRKEALPAVLIPKVEELVR